jgi:hypothetical protein
LINRDAATVYADAVKTVKQRGFTQEVQPKIENKELSE